MNELGHLINYLQSLRPDGPKGFEGLVANLLEGLTGQRFFLAHPGSQEGRDTSTGGFGGTWIAVEAKRFQNPKSFNRRELLGELGELPQGVDLWIIASTTRVPDQIISVLREKAAKEGIAIEALDAPPNRLGDLLALCAAHEDIVLPFLGNRGAVGSLKQILEAIRCDPEFSPTLESLRDRFSAGSIGYAQARTASLTYLRSVFGDAGRARIELGQPINVLETGAAMWLSVPKHWRHWNPGGAAGHLLLVPSPFWGRRGWARLGHSPLGWHAGSVQRILLCR